MLYIHTGKMQQKKLFKAKKQWCKDSDEARKHTEVII